MVTDPAQACRFWMASLLSIADLSPAAAPSLPPRAPSARPAWRPHPVYLYALWPHLALLLYAG